jgi:hypothetical protein
VAHIPRKFQNAYTLPSTYLGLESVMAVGTGFGQLFRGLGQVGGVGISSAIFQSILNRELHKRIHTPDAEQVRIHDLLWGLSDLTP